MDFLVRVYMRLVAYVSPVRICRTVFGARMRCRARDFIQRRIRFFGIFEHNLTYYMLGNLRAGDLVIDIGANVGYYTLLASRAVGDTGQVIAIEADPVTFARLSENLALNDCKNVIARNVAATETVCKVSIGRRDAKNSGTNFVRVAAAAGEVDGMPLKSLAGAALGRVKFIKIDIEGSEAPVLTAILDEAEQLRADLVVASEVSPESAGYVARFVAVGFRAYAMRNVYSIDYYLIRSYLRRFGEDGGVSMVAVDRYDDAYGDYLFVRGGG